MTYMINETSLVDCSHLSIQPDGDEFTIGDPQTGEFLRVPEIAVDVIRALDGKRSISQVTEIINEKSEEDVDVLDFAITLYECNLVLSIDGNIINPQVQRDPNKFLFTIGNILYSKVMVVLYVLCFFAVAGFMMYDPELIPNYKDIFTYESIGLTSLNILVVTWLLVLIHETGHVLAVSKEGIISKMRLNLRMIWLVAETDMTGLWSKPRSKRYLPFLAGMAWDVLIILGCFVVQYLSDQTLVIDYARLIAFLTVFSFLWQFVIFFRTDIYYVLSNWKNTSALHENSMMYLKRKFLKDKNPGWDTLPAHEKKNSVWFGIIYIIGGALSVSLFAYFQVPAMYYGLSFVIKNLLTFNVNDFLFWDSILVIAVMFIQLIMWLLGLRTSLRDRKARAMNQAQLNP